MNLVCPFCVLLYFFSLSLSVNSLFYNLLCVNLALFEKGTAGADAFVMISLFDLFRAYLNAAVDMSTYRNFNGFSIVQLIDSSFVVTVFVHYYAVVVFFLHSCPEQFPLGSSLQG